MADETKDVSKEEQLAVLIRYVDKEDFKIKERAIGLHHLKDCGAESIANEMLSLLSKKGLDIKKCVGQCYDGAKVMSGVMKGVQARIKELAPHASYFHCHAHRLNLVLVHSLGFVEEVKDFFSTLQTIYCFISNSSPRHEMFLDAQKELQLQPVLRLERLVPTRWFYWFEAVRKVLKTLKAILCVLAEVRQDRAESIGIRCQIEQPCFLFLLCTMELVLGITYSLSQQLQSETLDLIAAGSLIESTKQELIKVRSESQYEKLVKQAKLLAEENNIEWHTNKRKKSIPPRLSESVILTKMGKHEPNTKSIFFQILDTILEEFDRRFSDNREVMKCAQAFKIEDSSFLQIELLEPMIYKFRDFLDVDLLARQLPLARSSLIQICESSDLLNYLQQLQKLPIAYSEVISLIKIFLTLPITTAGNERFFSVLKRVKNYLRSTTSNDRLASLMILAVEREEVKKISLDQLVDDFAKMKLRRFPLMH